MIGFRNPYLLIAAVAAALPLLIYLITRDRVAVVPFSTLRFFAGSSVKLVRRKKWLETLLLAVRALLILVIVFAFARPFLQTSSSGGPDGEGRLTDATVLLVDVSQSMSRPGAWKQAIAKAESAIGSSTVTLVAFDQSPQVVGTWADAGATRDKLKSLRPQSSGTDLAAALRKADELLAGVAADSKRVVLVSDLQRAGLPSAAASFKLSPGVALQVEPIAADAPTKVAVVEANLPQSLVSDAFAQPITLRLANFAAEPAKDVTLQLALPNQPVQAQALTLPPNQTLTVAFRAAFKDRGDHAGTITLKADGVDQTIYLNPHVLPRIPLTILTAPEDVARPGSAAFFLAKAINPAGDSPFDVTVQSVAGPVDLKGSSVLILADVGAIPSAAKQQIVDFHRAGGGVLLVPGSRTRAESFNADLGPIAPAQLRRVVNAADTRKGGATALVTKVDLEHPILEVFQRPHAGDFAAVGISRFWEVADSQLSRVPLRLDDGRPYMLVKSNKDAGAVVLLAAPPEMSWSNLPQRAIYLPLLHQTLRYLAVRSETPTTYRVGDVLRTPAGGGLRDPAGRTHPGPTVVAAVPGLYPVVDSSNNPVLTYAVNTPFGESDPTAIPVDELKAAIENPSTEAASAGGLLAVESSRGREFWSMLIAVAIVLIVVELFVSNRVPRH